MDEKSKSFFLSSFVDADWAADVNDRGSTTSFCFIAGSSAISCDGVNITHAEAIWILGTFRTSIIVNN